MKFRLSAGERKGLLYFAGTVLLCLMLGPLARQWGCTRGMAPIAVDADTALADSSLPDSISGSGPSASSKGKRGYSRRRKTSSRAASDSLAPSRRRKGSRPRTPSAPPERRSFRDEPL